jgi:hypothetical protein
MTDPRGKSAEQKLNEAVDKLVKYRNEYAAMANKNTVTAEKKAAQIDKMAAEIEALKKIQGQPHISASARKEIRKRWQYAKYNRERSISNKYTKKGLMMEEAGITRVSLMNGKFYTKNTTRLYDDVYHLTGEVDLYEGPELLQTEETLDTKCSWDLDTFHESLDSKLKNVYYWQGQGYMHLTGAKRHRVCFCLENTPYLQVLDELKKQNFGEWNGDIPKWAEVQIFCQMVYDKKTLDAYLRAYDIDPLNSGDEVKAMYLSFVEIPDSERYYDFLVERNDEDIQRLLERTTAGYEFAMNHYDSGAWRKSVEPTDDESND